MGYILLVGLVAAVVIAVRETVFSSRALGSKVEVTETIDQASRTGAVSVDGKRWPAYSAKGTTIPAGTQVWITSAGTKLQVQPVKKGTTEVSK